MAGTDEQQVDGAPGEGELVTVRFVVEPNYRGWRLDRYLCAKIRRLSRAKAQQIIRNSLVADRPVKPSTFVTPGMELKLTRRRLPEPETPTELPVLYRDEDLLVVDKPAGLPMHPSARYYQGTLVTLARALAQEGEKPDPAHRLDRETSGIVLCGVRPEITRRLKMAFERSLVRKAYLAVVEGWPPEERFEVDLPLNVGGDAVRIRAVVDRVNGKPAQTRFQVLERHEVNGERFALLRCEPVTGRQHQIRIHVASAGFPIVGDKIYGHDETIFIRFTEKSLTQDGLARPRLPRPALHAAEVVFRHPRDG
ncbi:MAG: RluA family pseudouridine synthase, partial [Myxococcales bacterium]